jgi:hypothetical protein
MLKTAISTQPERRLILKPKSVSKTSKTSPPHRRKVALTKSRVRSMISNGSCLLSPEIDQRGPLVRRLKDLINDHVSDLGGMDNISSSERALVHRASMMVLLTEAIETKFILGNLKIKPYELADYVKTVGALRRVLATLGLQRRAKSIPSLKDYIDNFSREDDVEDAEVIE